MNGREENGAAPRRALILAGGGLKVAFQAGVMQVWLDEARLEFFAADGASGGVFNLAMYCEGRSGQEIADMWRRFSPLRSIQPNWAELWKLWRARSLLRYDRFRRKVLQKDWGLDWEKIRKSDRFGTFNTYNFSRHELEVVPNSRIDETLLVSAVSLPGWFPPIEVGGDEYIDAVYVTDANLAEAIRRGADELWIVWTVSDRGSWRAGPINCYFQIIEASANGAFRRMLRRIRRNNLLVADGQDGEFGRTIDVKLLKAEVPLHYLLNFTRRSMSRAVELGVREARQWCREHQVPLGSGPAAEVKQSPTSLQFEEVMWGFLSTGAEDFAEGYAKGRETLQKLRVELAIRISDVDRFISDSQHYAAVSGAVESAHCGGSGKVQAGSFNLFVDQDGVESHKRMLYWLQFMGGDGNPYTLAGHKEIRDDAGPDLWEDTTTLFTILYRGSLQDGERAPGAEIARGIIRVHLLDFLTQMTTMRTLGPSLAAEARGHVRFARFFMGALWDVYGLETFAPAPF